jgi:hypothetical protein
MTRGLATIRGPRPGRILAILAVAVASLGAAVLTPAAASASTYYYTGFWSGSQTLTHVTNVTVEGLPDATQVGVISDFQTNDPTYSCLNGEDLNLWTAPNEFPNEFVIHNGDQGSQCAYGTWTFPKSPTSYYVTLSAWIPQSTVDGAPVLPWAAYAALGESCYTPPWYYAPFTTEYITGNGDGHVGYLGSARAYVTVELGWNGSSITSFTPLSPFVATTTGTAYYQLPNGSASCGISKVGTQLSPTPSQTGSNSFSIQVSANNNFAPPPLNPPLDGALNVTISGSTQGHATFSFSGDTKAFPSYGVSVIGPDGFGTDTLSDVSGYGSTIPYELVALLLGGCACDAVNGSVSV